MIMRIVDIPLFIEIKLSNNVMQRQLVREDFLVSWILWAFHHAPKRKPMYFVTAKLALDNCAAFEKFPTT